MQNEPEYVDAETGAEAETKTRKPRAKNAEKVRSLAAEIRAKSGANVQVSYAETVTSNGDPSGEEAGVYAVTFDGTTRHEATLRDVIKLLEAISLVAKAR